MLRGDSYFGNMLSSRFPVSNVMHVDLSVRGREPRGAIRARLEVHGRPLNMIVTHLGLSARERREQIRKLTGSIAGGEPTILFGDINEWFPLSPSIYSIHRCLGRSYAARTFPSWLPVLALDRIWAQPHTALGQIAYHNTRLARRASDHLPLKARVMLSSTWAEAETHHELQNKSSLR